MSRLPRTAQCQNCPWKVDSDPHAIPGYDAEKHAGLISTIADPLDPFVGPGEEAFKPLINVMACHDSPVGEPEPCVGWLVHQIGPGNNIAVRIWMLGCENGHRLRTFGEQHQRFEDTIPTDS